MIENTYINALSSRLRNFKRKGNLYNFSCPLCNDSEKKKSKARAYVYEKKGKSWFHCHNCGVSMLTAAFIKTIDQNLYSEYLLEKLKDDKSKEEPTPLSVFINKLHASQDKGYLLRNLKKVSQLSPTDPIKKFVVSRKIPNNYHAKLFECPNFMTFTNNIVPNKFDEKALQFDEKRLLIPFISSTGSVHAFQGRAINKKSTVRYITIIVDESVPKVYGLDTVNFNFPTPVFEGPIDSMFIYNAIATAGGDLTAVAKIDRRNLIICYDNEPRSVTTVKKINKTIEQGYNVCIWPSEIEEKDVNDMVLAGRTPATIESIIRENTFSGLKAKLALSNWSKI